MKTTTQALLYTVLALPLTACGNSTDIEIDRNEYHDRLRGFWLGSSIANWTGLPTENTRAEPPFFNDNDWQTQIGREGEIVDYVLANDPWGADDDTDIEYVYLKALEKNDTYLLTGEQIAAAWRTHIGLPLLWVSNLAALGQMQNGAVPPATSLPENNPMWDMIDAQLTTEIFGAMAPARPDVALQMSHLPIRTTAYLHSQWAAEFYVIMHSLVALADPGLSRKEQVFRMAQEARKRVPNWSYIADMYDFVKAQYESNPDKDNWEETRDRVYQRYQVQGAAGYEYKYPWDAGINFAASIVSLLYGEGNYKKTIRIGTLAGWDADNPTATWGGLLGLLYGYEGLQAHFDKADFSDDYLISRTRYNFPQAPDNFTDMASRGLHVIDDAVVQGMGGDIVDGRWVIPAMHGEIVSAAVEETFVPWQTIEDTDPRWSYSGFTTENQQWNASGATLTSGKADCVAEITFSGTAVQYYAFRHAEAGKVNITLNGERSVVDLSSNASPHGQYYVKVFERLGLTPGEHLLRIGCDSEATSKNIDMLSIIPLEVAHSADS
ncbi:MAG: ADP-ribosylglycohydrolase family protein [bacterium]